MLRIFDKILLKRTNYLSFKHFSSETDTFKQLLADSQVPNDQPPSDPWSSLAPQERTEKSVSRFSIKPKIDPNDTCIILFPGQGSQFVGMAERVLDAPNVKTLFKTAKRILGYDLLELCLNGPAEKLNKTQVL